RTMTGFTLFVIALVVLAVSLFSVGLVALFSGWITAREYDRLLVDQLQDRLVEQAAALGADLAAEPATDSRVIHCDLHYANVLAADREPWLVIDPKPVNGDPHYEIAPMLWNRWEELGGDVREGVRRRFHTLVDAAGFDEDRARAWVVVRMVHNAMWALQDGPRADPGWLTTCISVAKAVQD
nr:aminoglycoside phosphotransferase family protein [Mycobacterium sp.]